MAFVAIAMPLVGHAQLSPAFQVGFRRQRRPLPAQRAVQAVAAGVSGVGPWIEETLGSGPLVSEKSLGGSGWSAAYVCETAGGQRYFVKTSRGGGEAMFRGEALGLEAMHATGTLRIPRVYGYGSLGGGPPGGGGLSRGGGASFICMEYLDIGGRADQAELGRRLALMHAATPADEHAAAGRFGFPVDNTIGGTPQPNGWVDSWVAFFRERRLAHQLALLGDARLSRAAAPVLDNLEAFFEGVEVRPSVLHGDLWSGNVGAAGGEPTVFDPATYYGHSEAEFGMSWCASFGAAFWGAYHEVLPRAPGHEARADLYTLYHYLNHANLFGGGYAEQAEGCLRRLAARL